MCFGVFFTCSNQRLSSYEKIYLGYYTTFVNLTWLRCTECMGSGCNVYPKKFEMTSQQRCCAHIKCEMTCQSSRRGKNSEGGTPPTLNSKFAEGRGEREGLCAVLGNEFLFFFSLCLSRRGIFSFLRRRGILVVVVIIVDGGL